MLSKTRNFGIRMFSLEKILIQCAIRIIRSPLPQNLFYYEDDWIFIIFFNEKQINLVLFSFRNKGGWYF